MPSKQRFLFHLVSCFSKNVVLKWCLAFYQTISRDCLESSWTGWIARFLVARSVEKGALHPVSQARGTTKWSPFGVSRQSLHALR